MTMSDTNVESIHFLPARPGEPDANALLFGLAGVAAALEEATTNCETDRDLIGHLAVAADALARTLLFRMGNCP
jgi:hypothetical protein